MLKIVLDANQYASALIKPFSNSARIIELVHEGVVALIISEPIITEVRRILAYRKLQKIHRRTTAEIEVFIRKLEKVSLITPALLSVQVFKEDPSDDKYLVCAIEGEADFIVSGDHHLKDLKSFRGIRIVDPATFLKFVTAHYPSA
jgi:putative PIN family toxin of toxin-antitoxin system